MSSITLDRLLPWSGAVAGLCWIGQAVLQKTSPHDVPGAATTRVIEDHLGLNQGAQGCLVIMGIALLCFATAVRNLLRSGEAGEGTYSSIAYAGWVVVVAGLSQMVTWNWGLFNGAADAGDDAALRALSYVSYFAWAGIGIGLATAFIATGLGGVRNAVLPRWFAILTVVMGALAALGDAGIPPGGLVNYLGLPFWLIGASVMVARSRTRSTQPSRSVGPVRAATHTSS
ncbi:hypothetical protein JCM18899A_05130 [Nocardioides sp. AN3]